MLRLVFVFLCALTLGACGNEKAQTDDGIPGGGEKKLELSEQGEIRDFFGHLGDALLFTETAADLSFENRTVFNAYEERPNISRESFRRELADSVNLNRCRVSQQGQFEESDLIVEVSGRRCRVETLMEQFRDRLPAPAGILKREVKISKSFAALNNKVESPITEAHMDGTILIERQFKTDSTITISSSNIKIEGDAFRMGDFSYNLTENMRRIDGSSSFDEIISYTRTDELDFEDDLRAVLYKQLEVQNGSVQRLQYFLNGEPISESFYYRMLQEFDIQVGLERYN